jgi:acyl-CoA dehydrogenase
MGALLRYPYEVRSADEYFGDIQDVNHQGYRMVKGTAIGATAMTEPSAGSDLKNIRTRAKRDGNEYVQRR